MSFWDSKRKKDKGLRQVTPGGFASIRPDLRRQAGRVHSGLTLAGAAPHGGVVGTLSSNSNGGVKSTDKAFQDGPQRKKKNAVRLDSGVRGRGRSWHTIRSWRQALSTTLLRTNDWAPQKQHISRRAGTKLVSRERSTK